MGRFKSIIKPFDSGRNYIQHAFFKFILLRVIWSWKCNNILKKKITSLQTLVTWVYQTTLNMFPHWISKPCIRKRKNHSKISSGAGKFAQNLRACKKSQYNIPSYKLGRHNQRHTFGRCFSRYKFNSMDIPTYGLKVKSINNIKTKPPFSHKRNWMLHIIKYCQDISSLEIYKNWTTLITYKWTKLI